MLGLWREENCFAAEILNERGLALESTLESLAKAAIDRQGPQGWAERSGVVGLSLVGLYTDLTQKAAEGALEPVVGRDLELEAVIEVLCKKKRRNPMLLGGRREDGHCGGSGATNRGRKGAGGTDGNARDVSIS